MKAFSFPLLCPHQSRLRTHPLDYHRSSFPFCFSPRVPIQSNFISPSVPFTAAFISTPSLNLPSFQQLSDKLRLTSSTCLPSFSPFVSTSRALSSLWLLPAQTFSSFIGIFLEFLRLPPVMSNALSVPPLRSVLSADQLARPA